MTILTFTFSGPESIRDRLIASGDVRGNGQAPRYTIGLLPEDGEGHGLSLELEFQSVQELLAFKEAVTYSVDALLEPSR